MTAALRRVDLEGNDVRPVLGVRDGNLKAIAEATGAELSARGNTVTVRGEEAAALRAVRLLGELAELVADGVRLRGPDVEIATRLACDSDRLTLRQILIEQAVHPVEGRRVLARTPTQSLYLEAVRRRDIVFAIGPAGTGKTYLAVALALEALNSRACRRIILTRPAVEAGERLGFLPGDLAEKVNPYLRPLHDAIGDLVGAELASSYFERSSIEVAPLAFMRGRTLNDSFIILDEGQNTTPEQMKMFLTRMGLNSRVVVTGDITQVDLPFGRPSGLVEAARILADVDGIEMIRFTDRDVVRHDLVMQIVRAYEREGRRVSPEAPVEHDEGQAKVSPK